MIFHEILIIVYITNEYDFQYGKRDIDRERGNNWTDLTCLTRAFSASLPVASAKAQRIPKMRRYLSEKRSIQFGANGYGTNGGGETVSCSGTARGLAARSKNHSRILPLTFLRFAQPAGTTCARSGGTKRRITWALLPAAAADGVPPTDFVCRHARSPLSSCRALKDRFSESLIRVICQTRESRAQAPPAGGTLRFCTCRNEISARSKAHR